MSNHIIRFCREIRKLSIHFWMKKAPYLELCVFNANSADPDQTPRSAASDPGLSCLRMSLLRE